MEENKQEVQDVEQETEMEENPISLVRGARNTFLKLLAFVGGGILLFVFGQITMIHICSFLGLAVFALPLVISLCFGFKIIDIGPIFRAVDTPIGNVIYRTMVPDVGGQMAANLALTLIRALLMFVLSVILMPLLLVFSLIAYKIGRRKAIKYAKQNGMTKKEVPGISPLVLLIYVAVLVVAIIGATLLREADSKKLSKEYDEKIAAMTVVIDAFKEDMESVLTNEYYAESYKGENGTGGFVAKFKVGDKTVLCGKMDPPEEYSDILIWSSVYYVIDGVTYVDKYNTQSFTVCEDQAFIEMLNNRLPEAHFGEEMTILDGYTGEDYYNEPMQKEGAVLYVEVEWQEERHYLHFDENNRLVGYGLYVDRTDMVETQFVFTDDVLSNDLKSAAEKLINGTATIQ